MSDLSSPDTDQLSEEEARKIRILKAVVIGLGVLILLALFTLVLGLALSGKSSDEEAVAPAVESVTPAPPLPMSDATLALTLPTNAEIQEIDLYGNRIAVRWQATGDIRDHIWIIDIESGAVLRKLTR